MSTQMSFKQKVARSFNQAAVYYDCAARMQKIVASKLTDKFQAQLNSPKTIIDLGCGTGYISKRIQNRSLHSHTIFSIDIAEQMLDWPFQSSAKRLCCDLDAMPFCDNTIDLIISSLTLQWAENLRVSLNEIYRTLKPGAYCYFSTLGPKTLYELRYCWSKIDNNVHVNHFLNQSEIFTLLTQSKFKQIKIESEILQLQYKSLFELMSNLKKTGAHNINAGQPKTLLAKSKLNKLEHFYEQFRLSAKSLPASYEVIFVECQKDGN